MYHIRPYLTTSLGRIAAVARCGLLLQTNIGWSACRSVCYDHNSCKTVEPIVIPLGMYIGWAQETMYYTEVQIAHANGAILKGRGGQL